MSWEQQLERSYTINKGWVLDACSQIRRELKLHPWQGCTWEPDYPKVRLDMKELLQKYDQWKKKHPDILFKPWQVEPRPEWHGKTGKLLGPGVVVFDNDKNEQYHLIDSKYIVRIS